MTSNRWQTVCRNSRFAILSCLLLALAVPVVPASAQTYNILYKFSGGSAGWFPEAGLVRDAAGNLYGTTALGGLAGIGCGSNGCGTAFKLTRTATGWVYSVIYSFHGGIDGTRPMSQLVMGADGSLYGTTAYGGAGNCVDQQGYTGCGTVFQLTPHLCGSPLCSWNETPLYRFTGGQDGAHPWLGTLLLDHAGNLYGTTPAGGIRSDNCPTRNCGIVFKLSQTNGRWAESIVYAFTGNEDAAIPYGGVISDAQGNLFGTTVGGGLSGYGTVYELSPNGSGWAESILNSFTFGEGGEPWSGVIQDPSGNLFGTTESLYGTVYEVRPAGNGWVFGEVIQLPGSGIELGGPTGGVIRDSAGDLYGTAPIGGTLQSGDVFKLAPRSGGGWNYTEIHNFGSNGDGYLPYGNLMQDASGNIYGTTTEGGGGSCIGGCGVIWEITP